MIFAAYFQKKTWVKWYHDFLALFKKKTWVKFYLKIMSQSGSPSYIAKGVAIGLFIGLFIPFGLQLAIAIPLAFLLKAAKIPAILLTFVTNQVTIFFIYPFQCYLGGLLLNNSMTLPELTERFKEVIKGDGTLNKFKALIDLGADVAGAFFIGGAILGISAAAIGYFLAIYGVKQYRRRREKRQHERIQMILNNRNLKSSEVAYNHK